MRDTFAYVFEKTLMQRSNFKKRAYEVLLICPLLICALLIPQGSLSAADRCSYVDSLIEIAAAKKLAQHRYWDVLIHYKAVANGKVSMIDDASFFLARNGKTNPEQELVDTVKSFFEIEGANNGRCRFPARYEWLKKELLVDEKKLPPLICDYVKIIPNDISSLKACLVYPTSYMGGMSTMFGHTMLRIDSSDRTPLLSLSISYSAFTREKKILKYAYKGLTGGFKGYYYFWPYYVKLKEYADLEERDIWEYELNLSSDEIYRMLLHVMELNDIYSDYFFMNENCSFNIFHLLEAARPSLTLIDDYFDSNKYLVIPADTVIEMYKKNLIGAIHYKPSLKTILTNYSFVISDELLDISYALATNEGIEGKIRKIYTLNTQQRADTLDAASKLVQYNYSKLKINQSDFQDIMRNILKNKSDFDSPISERSIEVPVPPHEGHSASRFIVGVGYKNDSLYSEIGWRPAYHDVSDPQNGFSLGNNFNFLETLLKYHDKYSTLELYKLTVFDFLFLQNRSYFFKPLSWKLSFGLDRSYDFDETGSPVAHFSFGSGLSWFNNSAGLFYGLLKFDLFGGATFNKGCEIKPGIELGIKKQICKGWEFILCANGRYNVLDNRGDLSWDVKMNNLFSLSKDKALALIYDVHKTDHHGGLKSDIEIKLSYFY